MNNKELQRRIDAVNEEYFPDAPEGSVGNDNAQDAYTPTDLYQDARNARYEANKGIYPKGSSQKVMVDAAAVLGQLARAHKKAKDDSEYLRSIGDKKRAGYVAEQYIEDSLLPAIEAVIDFNSVDEVLGSKKVLAALDKFASLDNKSASGYTASYIRTAHADEMGQFSGTSDKEISDGVRKIVMLSNADNISAAIGLAERLKGKVDAGENVASEEDYGLLQRVALR